ncbi:hypothetical protein HDV00_010319 [Rhizophlyctis rosea]|nr:hypothetical protein HDV00_010319 [Rhizophlyctis rosea]
MRLKVLSDGLPDNASAPSSSTSRCSLRGKVWKILLGVYRLSALDYITFIEKGPSEVWDKIKNDTFRTFAKDVEFHERVGESVIARLLNSFVWKVKDLPPSRLLNLKYSYVQGMNVLAGPFLYVMPELDAFYSFMQFIQCTCPLYVQPQLEGVHCGAELMDRCMQIVDPQLYEHLKAKRLNAKLYAFPSIMTLSACTPPLEEVLRLWDFYIAFGVHLNILCVIAQLTLVRDQILRSESPMKLLRSLPAIRAQEIISVTLQFVPQLPEELYDMLVRHPYDPLIYQAVVADQDGDEEEAGVNKIGGGISMTLGGHRDSGERTGEGRKGGEEDEELDVDGETELVI